MKFLFSGDIVIYNLEKFTVSGNLQEFINSHDIRCCNFEAPIVDEISSATRYIKAGPNISQTSSAGEMVVKTGFNLIALANNHIMDFGISGLKNTLGFFSNKSIKTTGAGFSYKEIYAPYIFDDENNKKIGIISLAQAGFGLYISDVSKCGHAWICHPDIPNIIIDHKKNVDILIIVAHAGLEDEIIPLPEWQRHYRNLIDYGADIIIASHPHIVQGYETYKDKKIFYSLGNFYFDMENMENNVEWNRSIVVSVDSNQINSPNVIPVSVTCVGGRGVIDIDNNKAFQDAIVLRSSYLSNCFDLEQKANLLAEKLWNDYYKSYYLNLSSNMSIRGFIKYIAKKIINKSSHCQLDETMLLHNIQIESHRWLVERYLYNKNLEMNKGILNEEHY